MANKGLNKWGKPIRTINIQKVKQQVLAQLKNEVRQQARPPKKKNHKGKKQNKNQTREISDFPLGTSQRNGFNKNAASKIITKDEYIGEVAGTVDFTVTQFPVNIGQKSLFPWGSIEALQWEKYEFLDLEFYLKPEVTQYTTNANSGKVVLSFDSDATDAPPATKQESEDILPMADGMSYQTVNLRIPKFILNSHLDSFYVRTGNLPGGSDIKTYDLGNLFVSTMGQGAAVPNMMELRVRYKCKLMIPILESVASAPQNNSVSNFRDESPDLTNFTPYTLLFEDGSSVNFQEANGLNIRGVDGLLTLPQGNYLVDLDCQYSCTAAEMNYIQTQVFVNGSIQAIEPTFFIPVGTPIEGYPLHQSLFVTSDGTTTMSVQVLAQFASGNVTVNSTLRIVAV